MGAFTYPCRVPCEAASGCPRRLDPWDRVWLTFAGVDGRAVVSLNGTPLGSVEGVGEYEVTGLLVARNELQVDLDAASGDDGLLGEVAMEVRCTAYLRDVVADRVAGRPRVRGRVVGFADGPLEIYVLAGRSTVAYRPVTASAEGLPFEALAEEPLAAPAPLRVELVHGAVVWYGLTLPYPEG